MGNCYLPPNGAIAQMMNSGVAGFLHQAHSARLGFGNLDVWQGGVAGMVEFRQSAVGGVLFHNGLGGQERLQLVLVHGGGPGVPGVVVVDLVVADLAVLPWVSSELKDVKPAGHLYLDGDRTIAVGK